MKERIKKSFKEAYIFEYYYIVVILCYFATVFWGSCRPGVVAAACIFACFLELLFWKKLQIRTATDILFLIYFVYRASSVIWLTAFGFPASVFGKEAAVSLIPMVFYFAGKAGDKQGSYKGFYWKFINALLLLGGAGFLLYLFAPQFYCDYLFNWQYISKADVTTMRVRMQSVVGSTILGALMTMGMAAAANFMGMSHKSSEQTNTRKDNFLAATALCFCFFYAIMSNQRAAIVLAALMLLYILYCVFFKFATMPKKYLYLGIAASIAILAVLCFVRFDFLLKIWWRIESLPGAVAQRQSQWVDAVKSMHSLLIGNGLGANGHKALGIAGAHVVTDGGIVKIFCEEGIVGASLFGMLLVLSTKNAIEQFQDSFADLGIVIAGLLLSIGSNVLAFQLVGPIFWYALGHIGREKECA